MIDSVTIDKLKIDYIDQQLFEIVIESDIEYTFIAIQPTKDAIISYIDKTKDETICEDLLSFIIYPQPLLIKSIIEDKPLFINYLNKELINIAKQEISDGNTKSIRIIDNLRFINNQKFTSNLISNLFSNTDGDIKIIADSFISLFDVKETPLNKLACMVLADMYASMNHMRKAFSDEGKK